jgi:hypothetical protein
MHYAALHNLLIMLHNSHICPGTICVTGNRKMVKEDGNPARRNEPGYLFFLRETGVVLIILLSLNQNRIPWKKFISDLQ